ncbi:MAG TPA: DUF2007 domain-containing protein [Mariprofundaceae bacterium]|nr:DUF2007 domain-containing protein [Mariprofundaceae bacterium]
MVLLSRIADPLTLQILCDALASREIVYRVENEGMNALMPLPGVMDARVLVVEREYEAALLVLRDLEKIRADEEGGGC